MKLLFTSIFLLFVLCSQVMAQISFIGLDEAVENNYNQQRLFAVPDRQNSGGFGQIKFEPSAGGSGWTFGWTYNGVRQTAPMEDSVLIVDVVGTGYYEFTASREGYAQTESFHLFFDYVPDFTISLSDIYNCTEITIDKIEDFTVPVYKPYNNPEVPFYGDEKYIEYLASTNKIPWTIDYGRTPLENYEYAFYEKKIAISTEDLEVFVTITDKFGIAWKSSNTVPYTSVIPKAEAKLELLNKVDIVGEVNEEMGQAPLTVEFHNNSSSNSDHFEWLLYKDTSTMEAASTNLLDSLIEGRIRTESEFDYTYVNTGRYKVILIAVNDAENKCADTTAPLYVNVIESLLEVPNVFTPNGDGKNDVFMVKGLSLENFHAVIINRWGRKVYEWSDPTGGWDGRINGKYANPGTYYYIITARGREKSNPPKYVKKGALMLIR